MSTRVAFLEAGGTLAYESSSGQFQMDAEHRVCREEGVCEEGFIMRDNYMIGPISSQAVGSKMDLFRG